MKLIKGIALVSAASLLAACGSDSDDADAGVNYPSTYEFQSKINAGESSVKFTGQATRQLLISELKNYAKLVSGAAENQDADLANMDGLFVDGTSYLKGDNIYGADAGFGTDVTISGISGLDLVQANYTEVFNVSEKSVDLDGKMAGCDNNLSMTQFIGWDMTGLLLDCKDNGVDYHDAPYSLMKHWIAEASANSYVDETLGLDYQQLFQKFLLGAITYSQTAEDYMSFDHASAGKGLKADNTAGDSAYTDLEHAWDEGFGYFGASLDYLNISDATIDGKTYHSDVNGDGEIDFMTGEFNHGLAVYASKHDVMTTTTNLSNDIMVAFLEGRQVIADNHGTTPVVGDALHTELKEIAGRAIGGLEKVIAISVVKYINQTINDIGSYTVGAGNNDVLDLAKHWSELKGFALGLQFNPNSTLTEAQLIDLHNKIGQSPINKLETEHGNTTDYIAELTAARTLIQEEFGFDATAVTGWGLDN